MKSMVRFIWLCRNSVVMASSFWLFATASYAQEIPPFNLNMDRIDITRQGDFGASNVYFIPTVYLRILAKTETSVQSSGSFGASAKAKVLMEGLDKTLLQGLAQKVYDDLVTKLRVTGNTVLTYSDLKDELTGMSRMKVNEKFGFPTMWNSMAPSGTEFAIATPSDEQAFDYGLTGATFGYRDLAKKKNLVVLLPDIYFNVSEVSSTKDSSIFGKSVELNVLPTMKLFYGQVYALPPSLAGGGIRIQQHGTRLASENVGTAKKVAEDKNDFAGWARTTGDYVFTVNPAALTTGVLRVGYAINDLIVTTVKKAH